MHGSNPDGVLNGVPMTVGMAELYWGDCLDVLASISPKSVDLVFTSPPYYNAREYSQYLSYEEYLDFLRQVLVCLGGILKPNCILAINLSCVIEPRERRSRESKRYPIPFDVVPMAKALGYKFLDDIIWEKPDGASSRAVKFSHHRRPVAYKPFQVTEYVLVFKNGNGLLDGVIRSHSAETIRQSLVSDGYERTNIWRIGPQRVRGHPAPFPLELAEKVVSYYSYVGDIVLDPFMGSGQTGRACSKLSRRFIGIEKSSEYYELARKVFLGSF